MQELGRPGCVVATRGSVPVYKSAYEGPRQDLSGAVDQSKRGHECQRPRAQLQQDQADGKLPHALQHMQDMPFLK